MTHQGGEIKVPTNLAAFDTEKQRQTQALLFGLTI